MEFTREQYGNSRDAFLGFRIGPTSPTHEGSRTRRDGREPEGSPGHVPFRLGRCVQAWHRHLRRGVLPAHPEEGAGS